ncbi:MAG: hypothetical protein KAW92_05160 [Candidatus Cloacimonetes bacterium]|nr:hypothetical protein [Candidatus Cloacimonadota bacterium]
MNEIEKIRDLDDEVFEEFKKYFPKIISSDFVKEYPKTNLLINLFDTSNTFIKNAIFDGCETDNYYGIKILYRSQIEHYLRFKYLFINWGITKSDEFATEYLEYNDAREVLDAIKAVVSEQQLYDSNFKIRDWDTFLQKHPKFSNKTRKEVDKETAKYSFKNIIRFLNNEFKKGENEITEFLGKNIIEYSNLSSYVHGGMKSYQEMTATNTEKVRTEEYNRISSLSFQMSNSIKLFSLLMIVQTDREIFSPHYLNIYKLLKRINEI